MRNTAARVRRMAFGRTWWGRQWVEAMERIDRDTNRLPRGRRYARGGMVKEIQIHDGKVLARVQGSRLRPYSIEISLRNFAQKQFKAIQRTIQGHPDVTSELLIGRLPERLLDLLNKENMHLLPIHWGEIRADCSCPDWANPCKHLAAVYYIIANEIDKDPFILLRLRGVKKEDLGDLIETCARSEEDLRQAGFLPCSEVILSTSPPSPDETAASLDLSLERLEIETLFSLLPDQSLFDTTGNLKRLLIQAYKTAAAQTDAIDLIDLEANGALFKEAEFYILTHPDEDTVFVCPPDAVGPLPGIKGSKVKVYTKAMPVPTDHRLKLVLKKGRAVRPGPVFDLFLSLPLELNGIGQSASFRFLNLASSVALSLIRAASYIPEVIQYGDGDFSVRYTPLLHEEKSKKAIRLLCTLLPPHLIFREKDQKVLMGEKGVHLLLSRIITHIFHRFAGIQATDKLSDTVFLGMPYIAERFEERQTAKTLADWLERLSIRKRIFSPVIRIEPKGNDFRIHIDIENKRDPLSPLLPLSAIFEKDERSRPKSTFRISASEMQLAKTEILRQIAVAADYLPSLKTVVHRKGREGISLDSKTLAGFLTQMREVFDLLGIRVVLPKELAKLVSPILSVQAHLKATTQTISYLSLESLLNFSWQIAIGDQRVSREEFLALVRKAEGVVRFKGHYLLLKPEEVRGILERLEKPVPAPSSMETLGAALAGELYGTPFHPDEALSRALEDLTRVEEIEIPPTLKATLRPYQERGFRWLYCNTKRGFGSCLADDMGLGKTLQVITLLLKIKEEGRLREPALVVCPTTLVGNWQKECERFTPGLKTIIYHGPERKLALSDQDLVITTYGIIRREVKSLSDRQWSALILDEAQNIKNATTDQTRAVKALKANAAIALSGTPVENRLTELWSLFDFINRGYLGPLDRFKKQFAIPIEKYRDHEKIERLRKVTGPFLLRRLKTDRAIITDLPEKIVAEEYCSLTPEQAGLYQQVLESCMRQIETLEGIERRGLIFKLITHLKQICNHPTHYLKKGKVEKEKSGKAEKTLSILEKIIAVREKALIFTQYKEMGGLLVELIRHEFNQAPLFFHGGISRPQRDRMVEAFQGEDRHRLMILSLKAGGTGLNLTSATNVVHYDLWWNPAVEAQATDRTYRIGQKRNVMIHRLITLGTFEEKINEMIQAKKELADLTVTAGEQWISELSNRELKEIFALSGGKA